MNGFLCTIVEIYKKIYEVRTLTRIPLATVREVGTAVAQWLRCCATNRKVVGSIPAGVIGIFH